MKSSGQTPIPATNPGTQPNRYKDFCEPRRLWGIKVNGQWVENSPELDDVRLRFELLLTAMKDMIDLRQYIRDEQVASVKIIMLEELIFRNDQG